MSAPAAPTRVFISYAQHADAHSAAVLALAQALCDDGITVELDRYHQHELTHWPSLCADLLTPERSDFVLMICSGEYRRRVENRVDRDVGRGVFWEGRLIHNALYREKDNRRYVPVLLDDEPEASIPAALEGWTWFRLRDFGRAGGERGYLDLLRLLTGQPATPRPAPGPPVALPPEPRPAPAPPPPSTQPQNLPYPTLGTLFKGRDAELAAIRAGFLARPGQPQAVGPRHAVHGAGGIGKTRLAVEYAWRQAADYRALLFISAGRTDAPAGFETTPAGAEWLLGQVATLATVLGVAAGVTESAVQARAVLDWLADPRHAGWLLILDNLDTEGAAVAADRLFGRLTGGHLLMTGRLAQWPATMRTVPLDVLAPEAARDFLLERTAGRRRVQADDAAQAATLARELDGFTLALEQAGAFIGRERIGFADYLARWRRADRRVQGWHDAWLMNYPRPLAVTWQTSAETLPGVARALLDVVALFG